MFLNYRLPCCRVLSFYDTVSSIVRVASSVQQTCVRQNSFFVCLIYIFSCAVLILLVDVLVVLSLVPGTLLAFDLLTSVISRSFFFFLSVSPQSATTEFVSF